MPEVDSRRAARLLILVVAMAVAALSGGVASRVWFRVPPVAIRDDSVLSCGDAERILYQTFSLVGVGCERRLCLVDVYVPPWNSQSPWSRRLLCRLHSACSANGERVWLYREATLDERKERVQAADPSKDSSAAGVEAYAAAVRNGADLRGKVPLSARHDALPVPIATCTAAGDYSETELAGSEWLWLHR